MILSIIAVIFFIGAFTARYIGQRYSTSQAPTDKLSVFATVENNNNSNNDASRTRFGPTVSIVIPCYNEEDRLPSMLEQTIKFCNSVVQQCQTTADAEKSRELGHFSDYE